MSNPRKFSEKIALHNQKQAEETAAFEKIMREVSDATKIDDIALDAAAQDSSNDDNGLRNNNSSNSNSSNNKNINNNNTSNTNNNNTNNNNSNINNDATSNKQQIPYRESRGRSVGGGPIRSRQGSRNIDTSPYGSGNVAYLSPPNDTVWRRTSSDSAIHQSLSQSEVDGHLHAMHPQLSFSPAVQKRISVSQNSSRTFNYQNEIYNDNSHDLRRNVSGLPRLPGIKVQPSPYDNSIQIPIGNNTGSLPDLTLVHIPSPMHTTIDHEHDQNTSSPYSTSPQVTTPTSMSPTTMSNSQNQINCQISNNINSYSSKNYENNPSQHYLSVPESNRFHQFNKILPLDNSYQNSPTNLYDQDYVQNINHISGQAQQSKDIPLNKTGYGSHGNIVQQTLLSGYRSPKGRPSPGSSPGIISNMSPNLDSNSSGPCSPVPQGINGQTYDQYQSADNQYINQFEQFSLDWAALVQTLVESGCTLTAQVQLDSPLPSDYGSSMAINPQQYVQFDDASFGQFNSTSNILINNNNASNRNAARSVAKPIENKYNNIGQYNFSNMYNSNSLNCGGDNDDSLQQTQTSQLSLNSTATSTQIPEIVFTDFSSDINDSLKLDIDAIDFDGFQMLSDPNTTMITDPTIEDSFRRDLN